MKPPKSDIDHVISKFSRGIMIGFWFVFLGLLFFLAQNYLEKKYNPNQHVIINNQTNEVILQQNSYGHYVASGFINEFPVTFLIDTGAHTVALSETLANKLQLKKQTVSYSNTANGLTKGWRTRLKTVRLGNIQVNHINAVILPNMLENEVLLGMTFLKDLDWQQKNKQLILKQY